MSARFNIPIDKRTPFKDDFIFVGQNWTGAAFLMHLRNLSGDTGMPIVALASAAAGVQGVSAVYNPAYSYVLDGVATTEPATIITIQIDELTLEAIPLATPADKDLTLSYDLHVTPTGGLKERELFGNIILTPGTTI
jgi:hypothetical protein